jgi:general stress protein CsbA
VHEDHEEKQDLALPMQFTRRVRRQKSRFACLSSWPSCSSWFNCFFPDNRSMKKLLVFLLATLAFNTAIAGVLSVLLAGGSFRHHFIFAQYIGLSIALVCRLIVTRIPAGSRRVAVLVLPCRSAWQAE